MDLKRAVRVAIQNGIELPKGLLELVTEQDYAQRGLKSVWKCPKCEVTYESFVKLSGISCECGKVMRKVWSE